MYEKKYLNKIRANEDVPLLVPKDFKFIGLPPFRHQVVTLLYGIYYKDLAIFSTMGTGKTRCAIDIARYWMQQGEINKILVVCPSSVLGNWRDEVGLFSGNTAVVLHHTNRQTRLNLFKQEAEFYIINYEATFRFQKQILKLNPEMVVFDESARIANPKAKQTKSCMEIAGHTKYRLILNGTPVANRPLDLWSQFYCLDFGETLMDTFACYRRLFFTAIKLKTPGSRYFTIYKVSNRGALDEIAERIAKKSIRYTKEECIKDLPEKTYQRRLLTLPAASRKLYQVMYDNAVLEISKLGESISTYMKLTKFVKALQITSGYVKTDDGNIIKMKSNPKLEELKKILEEVVPESGVVIWCKYLYTIGLVEALLRELQLDFITITGAVKDKSEAAKIYQNTTIADIPCLIGQIEAGGIGLNLHKASYAIYIENEWRLLSRYQSEDRIHRIGQKNPCTYIDLVIKDSIDEQILEAIRKKKEVADYIISKVR